MDSKVHYGEREVVRFNLMVIGESGLGKTTLLRSLLRKYAAEVTDLGHHEERNITCKTVRVSELGQFRIATETGAIEFHLHDSPGYGDLIDNQASFDIIHNNLLERHNDWLGLNGQMLTEQQRLQADTRIHAALYFISPHRMKDIDRVFLRQLHGTVPIIPVIAKADTMTLQERREYLREVEALIQSEAEHVGAPVCYDFHETFATNQHVGEQAGSADSSSGSTIFDDYSPSQEQVRSRLTSSHAMKREEDHEEIYIARNLFAVVSDLNQTRTYPWGTLHIDDESHSDFRRLQRLLFEEGDHIKKLKERTHELTIGVQRQQVRVSIKKSARLMFVALGALALVTACLIVWVPLRSPPHGAESLDATSSSTSAGGNDTGSAVVDSSASESLQYYEGELLKLFTEAMMF